MSASAPWVRRVGAGIVLVKGDGRSGGMWAAVVSVVGVGAGAGRGSDTEVAIVVVS